MTRRASRPACPRSAPAVSPATARATHPGDGHPALHAAAEIPAVAELAQYVGDLVPAHLNLVERRTIKDGQTSRFVVPVLDLQIGTERLKQIAAEKSGQAAPAQIGGGQQAAAQKAHGCLRVVVL